MTAPARLLSLRVHGFKSFAEKTVVEFGPGISAVVGPNGSGKSNLVDGLRWALGEQGRALRSRKSEDVIFAGSERRSAQGMADVVLTLDNADRLMPLDFGTLELGRRLFRSGENEYLLNRQRVRLRELVDLLDAAHLADNAFLFIGQGMVDQALALRPEERRPLFEEVAGVRRHERRKARAEQQLAEAELNLARVGDILAELRPQVRRLAAQAEQHTSRQAAARAYGDAVIAAAHARWHEAAAQAATAADRVQHGRAEAARAMRALRDAEEDAASVSGALASRSRDTIEQRAEHDAARTRLTELQLREARLGGELASVERDRRRIDGERAAADAELVTQRRVASVPLPARDERLGQELAAAERALGDALQELSALRAAQRARGEELAAIQRAEAARQAEREAARRSLAEAGRRADEEQAAEQGATARLDDAERELAAARAALEAAGLAMQEAAGAREAARLEVERHDGERRVAAERAAAESGRLAAAEARLEALGRQLEDETSTGIAAAARRAGGRSLEAGLQVEVRLRTAVDAALGDAVRAYVVDAAAAERLVGERGLLVVEPHRRAGRAAASAGSAHAAAGEPDDTANDARATVGSSDTAGPRWAAVVERATEAGGGRLADAITRDPTGAARRLLRRALWLPALRDALDLWPELEPGWVLVTQDGAVLGADGLLALGRSHARLELRAELDRLAEDVTTQRAATERARAVSSAAEAAAVTARERHEQARRADEAAAVARRRAEDDERRASRAVEGLAREASWHAAQAARLGAERDRAAAALASIDAEVDRDAGWTLPAPAREGASGRAASAGEGQAGRATPDVGALEHWERRVAELRNRRDRLAAEDMEQERRRRDAEARAAQAAASVALGEQRIARADAEARDLDAREEQLRAEIASLTEERAAAASVEAAARAALDVLRTADDEDRARLATAESAASASRERLRLAEERIRSAEVADLEARLGLDAIREQTLVELASLGELGPALLGAAAALAAGPAGSIAPSSGSSADEPHAGDAPSASALASTSEVEGAEPDDEADAAMLETALAGAARHWAATPPSDEVPSPARLLTLRRRFHDLGAVNPFAVEEHAAARARLDHLDGQRQDLETAIARTRTLIADLNTLIADQFRTTFRALEAAFDRRFRVLFGGGFARLSLTEPDDLAATGVEIVARPPGKKAQNLAMLSGGERALTAVALLFAMLEVRPVPFCVLDEVDAALDEANVGRFADSLRELAGGTQFIVITHNRGTIETADALYGVTIGDDAVSRIVSLRLEEAQELADRSSTGDALSPAAAG